VDKHVYDTTSRLTRERVMGALSPLLGEERTSGVWGRIETVQRTLGDLVAVHSEDNAFL